MTNNLGSQADPAVTDPASDATLTALLKGLLSLLAGDLSVQPFSAILEGGVTELVGTNEQVDQNEYGGSAGIALGGTYSGEILSFLLISTEDGTGSVQRPDGKLLLFDADPSVSAGASSLGAANWPNVIAVVPVSSADWTATDTSGAALCIVDKPVAFHELSTLYAVWFHESATSFNDAAGDDEQLELNFWYRRDS